MTIVENMKIRNVYRPILLQILFFIPIFISAQAPGGQIIRPNPNRPNPVRSAMGALSITSTPSSVDVKINGEYIGTTPLTLRNRKVGSYTITLSADGYEMEKRTVSVSAGKTSVCSVAMKKVQVTQPVVQQQTVQHNSQPVKQIENPTSNSSQVFTVKDVSFKMIQVEGGTFTMGATSEQGEETASNEKPTHKVTLSSYFIGETEVTQGLWEAVMGNNPSGFKDDNRPVENVSWEDCQIFISKLNTMTNKKFRLPTEAEWEYAARGGNKSKGFKYSGGNTIGDIAWYSVNSYDLGSFNPNYGTHVIKTKAANELGLYDMSGNVSEWCNDRFGSYGGSSLKDPTGPTSGSDRVYRGGSWYFDAAYCRVAHRNWNTPSFHYYNVGFRLAL